MISHRNYIVNTIFNFFIVLNNKYTNSLLYISKKLFLSKKPYFIILTLCFKNDNKL